MKKLLYILPIFYLAIISNPISAQQCTNSGKDIFGNEVVQCTDGNRYEIKRNELFGTTEIEGSNSRTGAQWNQKITDDIFGKKMEGTDKEGNTYSCRYNTLLEKWDC